MSKRIILIVEEEPTISFYLKTFILVAKSELSRQGLSWVNDVDIITVETLEDARKIIYSQDVLLVSLDLYLKDSNQGKLLSGMVLLRELREKNQKTMVIIVSGMREITNATDALLKYKALGYIVKTELNQQEYIKSIQSVLYYQNAMDLISSFEKDAAYSTLELAEQNARLAEQAAGEGEINFGNFPEDLRAKILALRNRLDKVTHLPSNEWVEKILRTRVVGKPDWSLLRIDIDDLAQLHPSQVNPLLVYLAGILAKLGQEFHYPDVFVGSYLLNQRLLFVVVTGHNLKKDFARICDWLTVEFEIGAPAFLDHLTVQVPIEKPRLDVRDWHCDSTEFYDLHSVIDALG